MNLIKNEGADRLRAMASELLEMAAAIEKEDSSVFRFSRRRPSGSNDMLKPHLAEQAEQLYRQRRDRSAFLPEAILGEPAWDMLLDLFVQHAKGRHVSTTSASIASGAPMTTALRYLKLLEGHGLINSSRFTQDDRVRLVELSPKGLKVMIDYFAQRSKTSPSNGWEQTNSVLSS